MRFTRMMAHAAVACLCAAGWAQVASAGQFVVYKLGVDATGANAVSDSYLSWVNAGGFNEGNANAISLTNTTLDYKDSFVDSAANWATVTSVNVGFYQSGREVASLDFNPDTSDATFYSAQDLTGSSWGDLSSAFTGNFFSETGDPNYNRRWFVEHNYGGCGNDSGWAVVLDATSNTPCGWESGNIDAAQRAFLFANSTGYVNWNGTTGPVGKADVFAITVTTASSSTPEPSTFALLGSALVGLGVTIRKRRKA